MRTPQDCCNIEMSRAFEIVLELVRGELDQSDDAGFPMQVNRQALDLVTAYWLIKVKGK